MGAKKRDDVKRDDVIQDLRPIPKLMGEVDYMLTQIEEQAGELEKTLHPVMAPSELSSLPPTQSDANGSCDMEVWLSLTVAQLQKLSSCIESMINRARL